MYFLEAGKFHYISFSITDHLPSLPWELRNTRGRRREKQEIFGKTISSSAEVWYYLDISKRLTSGGTARLLVSLAAVFSIVTQKWLRGRLHNFRPCLQTFIAPFPPTRLTTPGSPRVTHPLRLLLVILLRGYSHSLLHSFREKLFSTDTSTHFLKIMKTWNWQTKIPHNKFDKRRNYCNS